MYTASGAGPGFNTCSTHAQLVLSSRVLWNVGASAACSHELPEELIAFTSKHKDGKLLYCGFGSMVRIGVLPSPKDTARAVLSAATAAGFAAVVLHIDAETNATVCKEWQEVAQESKGFACCEIGCLSHAALFEKCAVVMHHGGSGTVAAAAVAGACQVIVPLIFDQSQWGERVEWAGVGVCISHNQLMSSPETAARALARTLDPAVLSEARDLKKQLHAEVCALDSTVQLIAAELEASADPTPRASAPDQSPVTVDHRFVRLPNSQQVHLLAVALSLHISTAEYMASTQLSPLFLSSCAAWCSNTGSLCSAGSCTLPCRGTAYL